jgi:hypothetical protein
VQTNTTSTGSGPRTTEGSSTADQAKEKAQHAAGEAKRTLRGQVDERSTQAGERVQTVATDVRSVGEELRRQGKDQPAKLADQAAERAERLGGYLRDNDADTILGDVEDFGRRRPWVVVAGGLALGFAASRFLKASSSRRYEQRREATGRLPARTTDVSPTASGIHPPATTVGGSSTTPVGGGVG